MVHSCFSMNRKKAEIQIKRVLSYTSSGSENTGPNEQDNFTNTKKSAKLKTEAGNFKRLLGNNYKLIPDHGSSLHQMSAGGSAFIPAKNHRRIPVNPNISPIDHSLETPRYDSTCCHLSKPGLRYGASRGVMSVTDIEVTMEDDIAHDSPAFSRATIITHDFSSPMNISPRPGNKYYPVVRCNDLSCDDSMCLWHRCVLTLPQHVIWEDKTVTIELEKNHDESFNFCHKTKYHKKRDVYYFLVTKVARKSKAEMRGLAVGDVIHSANYVPLQIEQKLADVNFKSVDTLRLQIQHPVDISERAAEDVRRIAESMKVNREIASSELPLRMSQPLSPSTSPPDVSFAPFLSPTVESIPLRTFPKSGIKSGKQNRQLPLVRVFVCGNATNEFVRCLVGDFIPYQSDAKACCFEISMKKSKDGAITVANSESFSYLFEDVPNSCINIQLVAVSDDSFFHHCCSWMFTPKSIFILTFDTKRLSQSSTIEMSRLCSLDHTVRTRLPGVCPTLRIYGITTGNESICPEEIQTLFYTSLGKPFPDPKVLPTIRDLSCEAIKDTQLDVFNILTSICEKQQVVYHTAVALDVLLSHRALTTTYEELAEKLQEVNPRFFTAVPDSLSEVIDNLKNTGHLMVIGSINTTCRSENAKEFVLPCMLFDSLPQMTRYTDRDHVSMGQQDIWFALSNSGVCNRSEILKVLNICRAGAERLLACMEDLLIIFPIRVLGLDSGFGETDNFLFPYLLEDTPFNSDSESSYEKFLILEFSVDIPSSSFYCLLSELSHTEICQSFRMRGQYVSCLNMQGEDIIMHFLKTSRQIHVYCLRSSQSEGPAKTAIAQHIHHLLDQQLPSTVEIKQTILITGVPNTKSELQCSLSDQDSVLSDSSNTQVKTPYSGLGNSANCAAPEPLSVTAPQTQASIPCGLTGENEVGDIAPPVRNFTEAEEAQVMQMRMMDLKGIMPELDNIYRLLSVEFGWRELAVYLDLSIVDLGVLESMLPLRPNNVPARTFLDAYFTMTRCTLDYFLRALAQFSERWARYKDLAERLRIVALRENINRDPHPGV